MEYVQHLNLDRYGRMQRLNGNIRHYHWGSLTALSAFRGVEPSGLPEAELWYDTPKLPFLVKLLAVESPLSLQAHPNAVEAREGFLIEEASGVSLEDTERSFRDDRAKPELVCAMTPFHVLCGFRETDEAFEVGTKMGLPEQICKEVASLRSSDWPELIGDVLSSSNADLIREFVKKCTVATMNNNQWSKVAKFVVKLADLYPDDPALLVIPLLRYCCLQPGEAIWILPGVLHSYLSGMAIEFMPPGDNVLRAGLTSKKVNYQGLVSIIDATVVPPVIQSPVGSVHNYEGPDSSISVRRLIDTELRVRQTGPQLLICVGGSASVLRKKDSMLTNIPTTDQIDLIPGDAVEIMEEGRSVDRIFVRVAGEAYLVGIDR